MSESESGREREWFLCERERERKGVLCERERERELGVCSLRNKAKSIEKCRLLQMDICGVPPNCLVPRVSAARLPSQRRAALFSTSLY